MYLLEEVLIGFCSYRNDASPLSFRHPQDTNLITQNPYFLTSESLAFNFIAIFLKKKKADPKVRLVFIYFFFGFAGAFFTAFFAVAFPLTTAFNAAPAENFGTFFAAILISLPV